MLAQLAVFLAVAFHRLLLAFLDGARNVFLLAVAFIFALQQHELLAIAHRVRVRTVESALAEAQIVDSVKNIRLAHPVVAQQAVYLCRKLQRSLGNILVVQYGQTLEYHNANLRYSRQNSTPFPLKKSKTLSYP